MADESQINETNPTLPLPTRSFGAFVGPHSPTQWITDALGRLSPRLLHVVRLVDVDGLTYDEAAVALGIAAGTVTSREVLQPPPRLPPMRSHADDYRRLKLALAETSAPMPAEPPQRLHTFAAQLAACDTSPT